jgi:hypothetical protein
MQVAEMASLQPGNAAQDFGAFFSGERSAHGFGLCLRKGVLSIRL